MVRLMDMEFITGSTEIDMRDSSESVSNMAKEYKNLPMETSTKAVTATENLQVLENTTGSTEAILKEILRMGSGMVMESGKKAQEWLISMKASI